MRTTHVTHGHAGFTLIIEDTPFWALALASSIDQVLAWAGHPCCGRGLGRIDPICGWAYSLLNWGYGVSFRHTTIRLEMPLTAQQAVEDLDAFPGWIEEGRLVIDGEDEYGDIFADGVLIAIRCDDCQAAVPVTGTYLETVAHHHAEDCTATTPPDSDQ